VLTFSREYEYRKGFATIEDEADIRWHVSVLVSRWLRCMYLDAGEEGVVWMNAEQHEKFVPSKAYRMPDARYRFILVV